MNAFRVRHLENALISYDKLGVRRLPLDGFIHEYFKMHKKMKSPDKLWIKDHLYDVVRWKLVLDHVTPNPNNWSSRLKSYFISQRWKKATQNPELPANLRCSFPQSLYKRIESSIGPSRALNTCNILNEAPTIFLRVNTNCISRDTALKFLINRGVLVELCSHSPIGLILANPTKLNDIPEFSEGLIEIQDESSQLVAHRISLRPGQKVLDFCAGSGGKSVIFGSNMQGKGKLYLHDFHPKKLKQAKLRLKKAKIKNYEILRPESTHNRYKGIMDWVIVDVPCSGTGHIRRSPDLKWTYNDDNLTEIICKQREIFKNALKYLKAKGKIVYITSSILNEENSDQIQYFCENHNLMLYDAPFHGLPQSKGMDGFFSATLEMKAP